MGLQLVIFSHSEYNHLWPIIEDSVKNLQQLHPIFISNDTLLEKPRGFEKYLTYDTNDCFAQRWIKLLPSIDSKYILTVLDIIIILNCDYEKLMKLVGMMETNNIDRISLLVSKATEYIEDDGLSICDLTSPNLQTKSAIPFDIRQAIWNKNSFLTLWLNFPQTPYDECENPPIQTFCRQNFRCYGLQSTDNQKIYWCNGSAIHNYFKVLLITIFGKFTFPLDFYMDMKEDFINIYEKYNLENKIEARDCTAYMLAFTPYV
jgi:hypothetical protein